MLSDKILRFKFMRETLKPWILHLLRSKQGRTQIESLASGNQESMRNIGQERIGQIVVPIPPAAEQTRIVAKLEELLSDLDAGAAELKAAQKKLQQYRQSLLKAAVEGALTADWRARNPPQETGAQLLARILAERRARWEQQRLAKFKEQGKTPPQGWQTKYPEPVAPDTSGLPALPDGWIWASLGQLLVTLTSGSRDWAPYYDRGSSTFVMAQNVRPWRPDFAFRQFVDPPENDRDRARSKVQKDDLLVTIVGANTGQACRVTIHLDDHFVCQSVALLRLCKPSMSEYVNAVLNSEGHGQRQFREMNYGAGRPHLSFDQIESVLVPLPPMEEQQEIVRLVESSLSAVEDVELQLTKLFVSSTAQRQNLLRAAFAGQLVPQDPNDEPARVLLERIRAERAATDGEARKAGKSRKSRQHAETP
jgi:type I restriction enzyme S subunit